MTRLTREQLSAHLHRSWDVFRQRVRRYLLSVVTSAIEQLEILQAHLDGQPVMQDRNGRAALDRHYHLPRR